MEGCEKQVVAYISCEKDVIIFKSFSSLYPSLVVSLFMSYLYFIIL
jgi:hypothetical protein